MLKKKKKKPPEGWAMWHPATFHAFPLPPDSVLASFAFRKISVNGQANSTISRATISST